MAINRNIPRNLYMVSNQYLNLQNSRATHFSRVLKNENIFRPSLTETEFEAQALATFRYQYAENRVYRQWVDCLGVKAAEVRELSSIPFLPIESFKTHEVVCGRIPSGALRFVSSGTTGSTPSTHIVNKAELYESSFSTGFSLFYGQPSSYCILALLPNYLERGSSSLVYMFHRLIEDSKHPLSGFILNEWEELKQRLHTLMQRKEKVLLLGVSYALLDLAESGIQLNENVIVMETGGMKGRRKEMLKQELHHELIRGLGVTHIHSEYGMTELLSQAYSKGGGIFECPPWMKIKIRQVDDPLSYCANGKTGGINVIDLANRESCSFIATKDLGRLNDNGSFEVMGRYQESDVRGCNLLVENY